jgi:hypothetical protein
MHLRNLNNQSLKMVEQKTEKVAITSKSYLFYLKLSVCLVVTKYTFTPLHGYILEHLLVQVQQNHPR